MSIRSRLGLASKRVNDSAWDEGVILEAPKDGSQGKVADRTAHRDVIETGQLSDSVWEPRVCLCSRFFLREKTFLTPVPSLKKHTNFFLDS